MQSDLDFLSSFYTLIDMTRNMNENKILFSPFLINGLFLKNRLTMAPTFLNYADQNGHVTDLLLDHYAEMASSGVAMVVVEKTAVHLSGLEGRFVLRIDTDGCLPGLKRLVDVIHQGGSKAVLQINYAGRYAFAENKFTPATMNTTDIDLVIKYYVAAAQRAQEAGFDGVEIHGGSGYLPVQFLSPLTNTRQDQFGGSLEGRMRFPVLLTEAVKSGLGQSFLLGYRFLVSELVPGGFNLDEAICFAKALSRVGIGYLSITVGIYESFFTPEMKKKEKQPGYMVESAASVKKAVPEIPVIVAGRIQTPELAGDIINKNEADLIGLARVLFADPLWPQKAAKKVTVPINPCQPACSFCSKRIMRESPAFCAYWNKERRSAFLNRIS